MTNLTLCLAMMFILPATERNDATVRVATFNIWELTTSKINTIDQDGRGANEQLKNAAEVVQRVRPDVLLINEIDFDPEHRQNAIRFRDRYLAVAQGGQAPMEYPYVYFESVNTGVPSAKDLDHDGSVTGPGDAYGFGHYPGQYGMALFSRFAIDTERARTFQRFLWKDVPNNLLPDGRDGKAAWYTAEEAAVLRLSSKSHWDVPVRVGGKVIHLLCSHPTPPVFDGQEDRNGRRNFDEIRFWADYISSVTSDDQPTETRDALSGGDRGDYIVDDAGRRGPLPKDASFIILGDLNADPVKGETVNGRRAIELLLKHERIQDPAPTSAGAGVGRVPSSSADSPRGTPTDGQPANERPGAPEFRERSTSHFGRLDYVLPSSDLQAKNSGVFWPAPDNALNWLVRNRESSSDHRLVWIDIK